MSDLSSRQSFSSSASGNSPRIVVGYSPDIEGLLYENLTLWTPETDTKPKTVLIEPFTYEIKPGNRVILVGPSGCGKSTLLRSKRNMSVHGSGRIIFSENLKNSDNKFCNIVIPQRANLPLTNLKGILTYPASDPEAYDDDLVIKALHTTGLAGALASDEKKLREKLHDKSLDGNHYLNTLSGGQQQKLMFARAIILNPYFVALDEATSALDKDSGPEMYRVLLENLRPDVMILSVAHRNDIEDLHNLRAEITKNGQFVVRPVETNINKNNPCPHPPCPAHCPGGRPHF